jgi:redox-sensitive bicupin YhaK (pirin superfamily)
MQPVEIDRIQRVPNPPRLDQWLDAKAPVKRGPGYEVEVHSGSHEGIENTRGMASTRTVLGIRVDGEKRVELEVRPGERAFLIVLSGAGRIEGDDTAVKGDDVVWFKPVAGGDSAFLGLEADVEMRALLYSEHAPEPGVLRV